MATAYIGVTSGTGVQVATHSITEDAKLKQIQRVVISNSTGTDLTTSSDPLQVTLANSGTLAVVGLVASVTSVNTVGVVASISSIGAVVTVAGTSSVSTVGVVANISSIGALVSVTGTINTVSTVGYVASANIGSVGTITTVATINTINTLVQFAKTVKNKTLVYSSTNETDLVGAVAAKKIKVFAYSVIAGSTAANTITFKDANTGSTVWEIPLGTVYGANLAAPIPSYLFACNGTNTPISIDFSSANTATISVSYWDDDAV